MRALTTSPLHRNCTRKPGICSATCTLEREAELARVAREEPLLVVPLLSDPRPVCVERYWKPSAPTLAELAAEALAGSVGAARPALSGPEWDAFVTRWRAYADGTGPKPARAP